MKKYLLIIMMLVLAAATLAACSSDTDDTTTAATTVTTVATTTEKLNEAPPASGVAIADVAAADSPIDRFAEHPALLLWENADAVPGGPLETPPTVVPYLSEGNKGIVVLLQGTSPEGGYYINQGAPAAEYLASMGYDVFICKYRLLDSYDASVVEDVKRAIKYVQYHADTFGIGNKKTVLAGYGTGALLAYIESCDSKVGAAAVDEIDAVEPKTYFTLFFDPEMKPDSGMFAGAAPQNAPTVLNRYGIYYDESAPTAASTLKFAFDLANVYKINYSEMHGMRADEYKLGGAFTEQYGKLYELMDKYLDAYGVN